MDINEKLDDILSNLKSLDFRLSNLETEFYEKSTLIESLNSAFLRHESRQFKDLKEIDELESKNKDELIKSGLYNLHDEGNDGPFYSKELCELFKKYSNELIAKEEYKYLAQLLDFENLFYNHRFFEYKKIKYFGEMEWKK